MSKFILKRLVASELILFKSLYNVRVSALGLSANTAQKAISPPAELLVQLYPALQQDWRGRIGLSVVGPGMRARTEFPDRSLRREDKNWRIEGDVDDVPLGSPYVSLRPGDYAVMEFHGAEVPQQVDLFLIAAHATQDEEFLRALRAIHKIKGGRAGCLAGSDEILAEILPDKIPENHPFLTYLVTAEAPALEEAEALGDVPAKTRLRRAGRRMTAEQFQRSRERAEATGRRGEELVDRYLTSIVGTEIQSYEWVSSTRPGSPFDFEVTMPDRSKRRWEVKSTSGGGALEFCISRAEIAEAAESTVPYDLIRVEDTNGPEPIMSIAQDVGVVLKRVQEEVRCPVGVTAGQFWIVPKLFVFDPPVTLQPFVTP